MVSISFLSKKATKATIAVLLLDADGDRDSAFVAAGGAIAGLFLNLLENRGSLIELILLLQVSKKPINEALFLFAAYPLRCCCCK